MTMTSVNQVAMNMTLELQGSEWDSWLHIASCVALSKYFPRSLSASASSYVREDNMCSTS